jgi:hypothetical protein
VATRVQRPDVIVLDPSNVPADWVKWLNQAIATDRDPGAPSGEIPANQRYKMVTDYLSPGAPGFYNFSQLNVTPWLQRLGISPGQPLRQNALNDLLLGTRPFAKLKHPTTGENLSLHIILNKKDFTKPYDAATNPTVLKLYLAKVPDPSLLSSIWNTLVTLVGEIRDVVVDALEELGNLACDVMNAGGGVGGQVAGAGAAAAAGMPPQAGAAGATIAKNACGMPPPPPPPVVPQSSLLPVVLLAGGAFALIALLSQKKAPTP